MITYHHIGGRNGTFPLPLKKGPLLKDLHLILYDADKNCFEQMKQVSRDDWGQISVYPYCIGGKTGQASFHLNFHPTTNSLYPFNEHYKEYNLIHNPAYGEYVFGDACKLMKTIDVDLFTLEDAINFSDIASVDFLSLDVQGAEYDVLLGSKDFLKKNCIGIQLEVEFVKLYQDQKTFSDINSLMNELGFELVELGEFGRCAPVSLPMGFRGLEQPMYAEAVYLKSIHNPMYDNNTDALYKAAFFALLYKNIGLCIKFLEKINITENNTKEDFLYRHCLHEIWSAFEQTKHLKLPKLSELFTNERFQSYYAMQSCNEAISEQKVKKDQLNQTWMEAQRYHDATFPLLRTLSKYELDDVLNVVKKQASFEVNFFSELLKSSF